MVFWNNRIIGLLRQAAIDQAKPKIRVVDTESFIHVAKAVWGDKYDYSQTLYLGSQKPITIICRQCGPFTLSQAFAHVRSYSGKARSCGCRHCERLVAIRKKGKETKCVVCGEWAKYRSAFAYPMCKSCKSNEQVKASWNMACLGLRQLRKKARHRRRRDMRDPWAVRCRKAMVTMRNRIAREKQRKLRPPTKNPDLARPEHKKAGPRKAIRRYERNGKVYQYIANIKPDTRKRAPRQYSKDWAGVVLKQKHLLGRKQRTPWQRKIRSTRQTLRLRPCQPTASS
jgi:hypothetical protein